MRAKRHKRTQEKIAEFAGVDVVRLENLAKGILGTIGIRGLMRIANEVADEAIPVMNTMFRKQSEEETES